MKYVFKLYVAGESTRAVKAIDNLKKIVSEHLENQAEVEVIDILDDPEKAVTAGVTATPTIVKQFPEPVRKSIADLSDINEVLFWLKINENECK